MTWANSAFARDATPVTTSGIEGIVTISPTRPGPSRAGSENARGALANAGFNVVDDKGGAVTSFTTDAAGRFRVPLKPGRYRISLTEQRFPRPCGPFEVEVNAGKM
ncbi:MAG TPA: SpaA isopeptide-forming pilin-related protein, partial [Chthoniobacterales bacterium]|nr:SpaA isopeptide-forming pilin-related protein [Chthoniobacterales bacterium]